MAEGKIVVCPQCGKKFKLKAETDAASFACTACGATVWIDGKPKTPSTGRKRTPGRKASGGRAAGRGRAAGKGRAARGGRGAPAAKKVATRGHRRGRGREEEPDEEGGRHRGSRYQKKDNSMNVVMAVGGLVILVGAIAFFAMKDDDKEGTGEQQAGNGAATPGMQDRDPDTNPETGKTDPAKVTTDPGKGGEETTDPKKGGEEADPAKTDGNGEKQPGITKKDPKKLTKQPTKYKIDPKTGKRIRKSRYNPPADLGHLESTSAEDKKKIDELIATLFDPDSGRDGFDAKRKLIATGKPAFCPLLAEMVRTKKKLKWDRSIEDNIQMSSVRLADEVLREMDGWVEAKNIQRIVPGTDEKYFDYVTRMYYKRWLTVLQKLDKMPGPYDPSAEYAGEKDSEDD
ncbi:MAG: hypothetical protein ACYTGZ_12150 [Planctomycetota bacterium]|jgi:DNA-directed RNA polymerase subunit RPC12/RpoP